MKMPKRGDPCTLGDGKPIVGRGWCSKHYAVWQRYGDPLYSVREYKEQAPICSTADCGKPSHAHGLCKVCYKRDRNHGETTDPRKRRFWAQVDRGEPDKCWPWTGYVQSNGYGTRSNHQAGETRLAHRIAYEELVGPIPEGLVLDHLCHTRDPQCADGDSCPHRRCCNPAHLEPITRRENVARGRSGDSWGYTPEALPKKPPEPKPLVCTEIDDGVPCSGPIYKRTICRKHYRRWLRDPSVDRPSQSTPEQRFWAKVDKRGPIPEHRADLGRCWLWTASVNGTTGYGRFGVKHGQMMDAHRYSYLLEHGSIGDGLDVHHECHRRDCVRPDHLRAVSRSENLALRKSRR